MKRIGYLYNKLCNINLLKASIIASAKAKKHRHKYIKYIKNADYYATLLQNLLLSKVFVSLGNDSQFQLIEKNTLKVRDITAPKFFPDQCLHRALMTVIEPILLKGRYEWSCCGIKGRGTYTAYKKARTTIFYKNVKYCLKADIKKFYPSINRQLLLEKIKRKIKDKDIIKLCSAIIFQAKGTGLPIGYMTSARFAELFLESFDHTIKQTLKIKHYIRYADDLVMIDTNKRKLKRAVSKIDYFLQKQQLLLKQNWQVFDLQYRALDFCGYRYFIKKYVRIRKYIFLSIMKSISKIKRTNHICISQAEAFVARFGMFKRCRSKTFYVEKIKPTLSIGYARFMISRYNLHLSII